MTDFSKISTKALRILKANLDAQNDFEELILQQQEDMVRQRPALVENAIEVNTTLARISWHQDQVKWRREWAEEVATEIRRRLVPWNKIRAFFRMRSIDV